MAPPGALGWYGRLSNVASTCARSAPNKARRNVVLPEPTSPAIPDDLARPDAHTLDVAGLWDGDGPYVEDRGALLGYHVSIRRGLGLATDHRRNDRAQRRVGQGVGAHEPAVAQHRGDRPDAVEFLKPVADVEHAAASPLEFADHREQAVQFLGRQRCGRFVHQHDLRVDRQRLRDGHELTVGDGQLLHDRGRREVRADPG